MPPARLGSTVSKNFHEGFLRGVSQTFKPLPKARSIVANLFLPTPGGRRTAEEAIKGTLSHRSDFYGKLISFQVLRQESSFTAVCVAVCASHLRIVN